jgi:hypothetical protein
MGYVRLDFAVRALNPIREQWHMMILADSHTKLYDVGLDGQFRHWYLMPTIV